MDHGILLRIDCIMCTLSPPGMLYCKASCGHDSSNEVGKQFACVSHRGIRQPRFKLAPGEGSDMVADFWLNGKSSAAHLQSHAHQC